MTSRVDQPPFGWTRVLAMGASVALFVSLVVPAPAALRFLLALAFVALGPGTAILLLLGLLGGRLFARLELGLIVALGMAVTALTAEALLWIKVFDPRPQAAVAAAAVFFTIAFANWQTPRDTDTGRLSEVRSGGLDTEAPSDERAMGAGLTKTSDVGEEDSGDRRDAMST
jgi:hypothetical protein